MLSLLSTPVGHVDLLARPAFRRQLTHSGRRLSANRENDSIDFDDYTDFRVHPPNFVVRPPVAWILRAVKGRGEFVAKQPGSKRLVGVVLEAIGGPLLWGLILSFAFYFALHAGPLNHPLLVRYTAGHWVEYAEVGFFFIGLVAIVLRARMTLAQLMMARRLEWKHAPDGTLAQQVAALGEQARKLPQSVQHSHYVRRLTAALDHLQRHNSSHHLDDELKYLSDMDVERSHAGYALVRIVIWATPMLGFLGTVIGITMALGDLSPEALVNSPKEAMEGLLAGLSVAFDTTALALTLSIVLMFLQFLTQQVETQLLSLVDQRITDDLAPYFRDADRSNDPQVATLQYMAQAMIDAMEKNTRLQTEIWQQALADAHRQWTEVITDTGESVLHAVAGAVREGLESHTNNLVRLEEAAGQVASSNWQQWHQHSAEMLRRLETQQSELLRHGEILTQALRATGEVVNLEKALNQNLRALAGAKNFEDTVMSLSAAIHLLSSRLSRPLPRDAQVKLEVAAEGRAA
jgi:biopolymer transport protein ExbB/TolQ